MYNCVNFKSSRQGDNRTSLNITRGHINQESATQNINTSQRNMRFVVNSFVINSATNELDPFGIVRIEIIGGDTRIYQLDEVENIILDQQGHYIVTMVDRLGNSFSIFVDIFTPSLVSNLILINNGEIHSTQLVSGGARIDLPVLESENKNLRFMGWEDSVGRIHNGNIMFAFGGDTTLHAVWHYIETTLRALKQREGSTL